MRLAPLVLVVASAAAAAAQEARVGARVSEKLEVEGPELSLSCEIVRQVTRVEDGAVLEETASVISYSAAGDRTAGGYVLHVAHGRHLEIDEAPVVVYGIAIPRAPLGDGALRVLEAILRPPALAAVASSLDARGLDALLPPVGIRLARGRGEARVAAGRIEVTGAGETARRSRWPEGTAVAVTATLDGSGSRGEVQVGDARFTWERSVAALPDVAATRSASPVACAFDGEPRVPPITLALLEECSRLSADYRRSGGDPALRASNLETVVDEVALVLEAQRHRIVWTPDDEAKLQGELEAMAAPYSGVPGLIESLRRIGVSFEVFLQRLQARAVVAKFVAKHVPGPFPPSDDDVRVVYEKKKGELGDATLDECRERLAEEIRAERWRAIMEKVVAEARERLKPRKR